MEGRIVKGVAGFYDVLTRDGIYVCHAKGIFRKDHRKPLIGDLVQMEITHAQDREGSILEILPRKNELIRPAIANVDRALVIFAVKSPNPNLNLLDRFLTNMQLHGIPCVICFNKADLLSKEERVQFAETAEKLPYPVLFTSAKKGEGTEELRAILEHGITTVAGPSGVGKSSLINLLQSRVEMETGDISAKIGRGRHTTRHAQLIPVGEDGWIADTPGFTSLEIPQVRYEELWKLFPEFAPFEPECRFSGCLHMAEPDCGIKQAVERGEIAAMRYENYRQMLLECKDKNR